MERSIMIQAASRSSVIIIILLITLAGLRPSPARQLPSYPLDDRIATGMIFIHFTPQQKRRIMDDASSLFTMQCSEAFIAADLLSPTEVVLNSEVVFLPATDLYIYEAHELGLRDERIRRAYAAQFSSGRAQAGVVRAKRRGIPMTIDGRPRVFLHDTAFYGKSILLGTLPLREVLIHEFIHLGGQPQTYGWLGPLSHDLAGFPHYEQIMEACK